MASVVQSSKVTILDGETDSDVFIVPPGILISALFVPDAIAGATLSFFGKIGNNDFEKLNFSFDLGSSDPVYKGMIITGLAENFSGISARI